MSKTDFPFVTEGTIGTPAVTAVAISKRNVTLQRSLPHSGKLRFTVEKSEFDPNKTVRECDLHLFFLLLCLNFSLIHVLSLCQIINPVAYSRFVRKSQDT